MNGNGGNGWERVGNGRPFPDNHRPHNGFGWMGTAERSRLRVCARADETAVPPFPSSSKFVERREIARERLTIFDRFQPFPPFPPEGEVRL
jgi:hypothetical protein